MTSEKSHVGMGYHLCPVCGNKHDEVVLLDKRLKATLARENFMGWAMCAEHQKLRDDGYIALVECKNTSPVSKLEDADRTGRLAHIRTEVFKELLNMLVPEGGLAFVEDGLIAKLQEIMP